MKDQKEDQIPLQGYITNSQYDQLPVGLIAQLVEHCIGVAEVMGSNPVQACIFFFFFQAFFSDPNCLSCVVTARIFLLFDLSSAVQIYVSYIYIHLFILHWYITNSLESRSSLHFFQAFFSQLLKLRSNCEDLSSI